MHVYVINDKPPSMEVQAVVDFAAAVKFDGGERLIAPLFPLQLSPDFFFSLFFLQRNLH